MLSYICSLKTHHSYSQSPHESISSPARSAICNSYNHRYAGRVKGLIHNIPEFLILFTYKCSKYMALLQMIVSSHIANQINDLQIKILMYCYARISDECHNQEIYCIVGNNASLICNNKVQTLDQKCPMWYSLNNSKCKSQ